MEEILLQTIIDKLESLDKTNEKLYKTFESVTNYDLAFKDVSEKIRMTQMAVQGIPELISIPGKEIQAQRLAMVSLTEQLKKPLQQKTIHHLKPPHLLSAFLIGIIICLAIWIFILYPGSQKMNKPPVFPTVTVPTEGYPKENFPRIHKRKEKMLPVKTHGQASAARAKQMRIDSLYKILMNNYEQERAGKQATAADKQSTNSQLK